MCLLSPCQATIPGWYTVFVLAVSQVVEVVPDQCASMEEFRYLKYTITYHFAIVFELSYKSTSKTDTDCETGQSLWSVKRLLIYCMLHG